MGILFWFVAKGSNFLGFLGKLLMKPAVLVGVAIAVLLAAVWLQTKNLDRMKVDRDNWRRTAGEGFSYAKAWHGSFDGSERIRGIERQSAVAAITEAGKACQARVDAARASAQKIEALVTKEPKYDQAHCAVRELWNRSILLDATGWPGDAR